MLANIVLTGEKLKDWQPMRDKLIYRLWAMIFVVIPTTLLIVNKF